MEISSQGRDATGVRVARLAEGETVSAVAPVLEAESVVEGGGEVLLTELGAEELLGLVSLDLKTATGAG